MVYILLSEGFEEIEALTPADILRRSGVEVKLISADGSDCVTGAHGITVAADGKIGSIDADFDMIVLPGGYPGYVNLENNKNVKELVASAVESGKYVAAICAAPSVLGKWGFLKGKKATCYPSFEDKLTGAEVTFDDVVCDGQFITSRGAGTAHKFAFKLTQLLKDAQTAEKIRASMVYGNNE